MNRRLLVKRKPRVHLRRHLARHDLQNLTTELNKQVVQGSVDLVIDVLTAVGLAVSDRIVDQLRVLGLLRRGEDEGRVGGGVLRLVLADGREVAGVADDGLGEETMLAGGSVFTCWW